MKLTPEQIREKAKNITRNCVEKDGFVDAVANAIVQLIEEATGEKLPDPFESNVRHGSVWGCGASGLVLLLRPFGRPGELQGVLLSSPDLENGEMSEGAYPRATREVMIERLKKANRQYIGQYDFAAGLPSPSN